MIPFDSGLPEGIIFKKERIGGMQKRFQKRRTAYFISSRMDSDTRYPEVKLQDIQEPQKE